MVEERMLHVRFDGRSLDLAFYVLDVGDVSTDGEIRLAVARYLGVPIQRLAPYVVERHANGNITIRPEAVFG
jgi:hypothetical protein